MPSLIASTDVPPVMNGFQEQARLLGGRECTTPKPPCLGNPISGLRIDEGDGGPCAKPEMAPEAFHQKKYCEISC